MRLGESLGLLCLAHALELLADALLALPLDALRLQPLRLHALCLQPLRLQPRLLRCLLSLLFGLALLRHGDPRGPSTGLCTGNRHSAGATRPADRASTIMRAAVDSTITIQTDGSSSALLSQNHSNSQLLEPAGSEPRGREPRHQRAPAMS